MSQIDWTNSYVEMDDEQLTVELDKYTKRGFKYIPFSRFTLNSSRVVTPSGNILTTSDIEKILSEKLVVGDKEQLETLDAIEFFKISEVFEGED